jgi:cob(I)alamin adenosyltransferase
VLEVMIDYTINLGALIQIAAIVGGGLIALIAMKSTVENIKDDMDEMKTDLKKVGEALVTLAVASKRLDHVEEDIREMKHGRGFVQRSLNGEY